MITLDELVRPLREAAGQPIPCDAPLFTVGVDSSLVVDWLLLVEDCFQLPVMSRPEASTARVIYGHVLDAAERLGSGEDSLSSRSAQFATHHLATAAARRDREMAEAAADESRLRDLYPWTSELPQQARIGDARIADEYRRYVTQVSPWYMAISAELAQFLHSYCAHQKPRTVLDLGSGLSSVVLGLYAQENPGVRVWTVDDSAAWLARTQAHLAERKIGHGGEFVVWGHGALPVDVDLVVHDIGDMRFREAVLPEVLSLGRTVILDDVNKPYGERARRLVADRGLPWLSLRSTTVDRLGRFAALIAS